MARPEEEKKAGLENLEVGQKDWALEVLSGLSDNPEEDLEVAFREFWGVVGENGGGNQVSAETLGLAAERCQAGDYLGAILALADGFELGPVAGDQKKVFRGLRNELRATLPQKEEERVLAKGMPSRVFRIGWESHWMIGEIAKCEGDLSKLNQSSIDLVTKEGRVTGVVFREKKEPVSSQPSFKELQPWLEKEEVAVEKAGSWEIEFAESLSCPKEGQSTVDWAVDILKSSFSTLIETKGLPKKPFDVAQILKDDRSKKALIRALEAAQVLFGERAEMSLVFWEKGRSKGKFGVGPLEEFVILNWLSLIRACLDVARANRGEEPGFIREGAGVLTELPLGDLKVKFKEEEGEEVVFTMKGGAVDLVEVSWVPLGEESLAEETPGVERDLWRDSRELTALTKHAEGEFRSQRARYRRSEVRENGQRVETRTRLGRTYSSFEQLSLRKFGRRTFRNKRVVVVDEKFQSGDVGRLFALNVDALPVRAHVEQVAGYLFWVLAQQCWVEKWSRLGLGEREDFAIGVEDVVQFVRDHGILVQGNVWGEIRYELADEQVVKKVVINNEEELRALGERVIRARYKSLDQRAQLKLLRALRMVTRHRREGVEEVRLEPKELPESLEGLCESRYGAHYLMIENLAEKLFPSEVEERRVPRVEKAIFFEKEGVFALWITGLLGEKETLRIGIDQRAAFAISGLKEGLVRGRLANRELVAVSQEVDDLVASFEEIVWGRLTRETWVEVIGVSEAASEKLVVGPDGSFEESIEGKPIVCVCDPLTGRWVVKETLLKEAAEQIGEDGRDPFFIGRIIELANKRPKEGVMLYCPIPTHDNRDTEAATWDPGHREDYGHCFVCGSFSLPSKRTRIKTKPMAAGYEITDYELVSRERGRIFGVAHEASCILGRHYQAGRRYIAEVRGVDPDSDLGPFGFVPPGLGVALANLTDLEGFGKVAGRFGRDRLDRLAGFARLTEELDDREVLTKTADQVLGFLDPLPRGERSRLLNLLALGTIKKMRGQGIIGRGRVSREEEEGGMGWEKWGGRILIQPWWFSETARGYKLVPSNLTGRGVLVDGQPIYEKESYTKAPTRRPREDKEAKIRKRGVPVGVVFRDREAFLLNVEDQAVVCEGFFSQASLGRFAPELRDFSFTMSGLGYRELIAFLRWLGVKGDQSEFARRKTGRMIQRAVLAFDFDGPGTEAFWSTKERLELEFPRLEVLSIHRFLPPDVAHHAYPYDRGRFKKEGDLYKEGRDLNDILLMPEMKHYRHFPPNS